MSDLTARELLEEALTHLTAPVGRNVEGDFITRWCIGDEFAGDSLLKDAVTIMDPDGVWDDKENSRFARYRTMCAIGALALATLSQEDRKPILNGSSTDWKDWATQNAADPEVALATIALIYVASEQPEMKPYVSAFIKQNEDSAWGSLWRIGHTKPLSDWMKAPGKERANFAVHFVGFVTNYNDNHCTSYLDAAEMFEKAIKLLIEAEGAL